MSLVLPGDVGGRADCERGGGAACGRLGSAVCGVCSFLPHDVPHAASSIAAMSERFCVSVTEDMSGG